MNHKTLEDLMIDDLVAQFAEACVGQDRALIDSKISTFNRLYQQMDAVDKELQRRGAHARLALCELYEHPKQQVQLQAAKCTLAVAPVEARRVIEAIAKSGRMPQAADARGSLRNLDEGIFRPD
jgi:hypothetical protein